MPLLSLLKVRWRIEVKLCLSVVQLEKFLTSLKLAVDILPASFLELCCHFILDRNLSRKKSRVFKSGHKCRKMGDSSVLCITTYTRILLITFETTWYIWNPFVSNLNSFWSGFVQDNNRYLQRKKYVFICFYYMTAVQRSNRKLIDFRNKLPASYQETQSGKVPFPDFQGTWIFHTKLLSTDLSQKIQTCCHDTLCQLINICRLFETCMLPSSSESSSPRRLVAFCFLCKF